MCGICGIVKRTDIAVEEQELIRKMNKLQWHRGPDDEGVFVRNRVALGHRRLSIFDLSPAGHQPMLYMDKYVISYNGEIYNYLELKEELKREGYQFFSNTDTEVIMAAYDKWGMKCLQKFNGFWAFALFELESQRLILSRDRFGVKPLYYCAREDKIAFASEIKALLADHSIKRVANEEVIQDFLVNGLVDFSEATFFKGIYKVPTGCNMIIYQDLTYETERFHKVIFSDEITGQLHPEEIRQFRKLFADAVDLRMRADVAVGSCLSGGLDSSSIVCQIHELLKRKGEEKKQETFSACYKNFTLDEKSYIDKVIDKTNVKANFVYPSPSNLAEDLEKMIYHQDEPFATMSVYASYCVMRLAKERGVTVLLDGQGADEILCGYRKARIYYVRKLISNKKYRTAIREILCSLSQFKTTESRKNDISKIKQILLQKGNLKQEKSFLGEALSGEKLKFNYNCVENFISTDFYRISLPALLRIADKNSMAFSVEDRLPFLDYRFVEYCAKLPLPTKLYRGWSKYIMRRALNMPGTIRRRKDKIGFSTPDLQWIKENENYFFHIFTKESFRAKRFINNKKIVESWNDLMSGKVKLELFRYICLELWMEKFCVE